MTKHYGQFCGLARAAEIVGERWTLLILRDLSVGPARFSELKAGLPGIVATMLTARLRDLESAHLVSRQDDGTATTYALTGTGESVLPALRALSLWGASAMTSPRPGERVTPRSLASMLASTRTGHRVRPFTVELRVGEIAAHAHVLRIGVDAHPGPAPAPELVLGGPGLRRALAQPGDLPTLIAEGQVTADGDGEIVDRFARAFHAPLHEPG